LNSFQPGLPIPVPWIISDVAKRRIFYFLNGSLLEIIQIVPRLPPAISGVGDYAYLLARQLRAAHNVHTRFVVCDLDWNLEERALTADIQHTASSAWIDGFPVFQQKERSAQELLRIISAPGMPATVLLQFVGYGYEKRGCPLWLVQALTKWCRKAERGRQKSAGCPPLGARRLITMFHELYAFGPPWRSSFWTSPMQRWIATKLACKSNACVTNMRRYADWLSRRAPQHAGRVKIMPVFSNVGEVAEVGPIEARPPRMVIFGGARWVRELLGSYREETLRACRALGLREIVTIGSPVGMSRKNLPIPLTEYGYITADRVAELIRSSRVGMMNYFPGYLAKSGIFAAYAALGVLPVLARFNPSQADGCVAGKTYLVPDSDALERDSKGLQQIVDNAREWYRGHDLNRTADVFAETFAL
jgi:hypothetical protein